MAGISNAHSQGVATIAALALVFTSPCIAQTAVDGDTIRIGAAYFRLWGIDAPESRQVCRDGWAAGAEASSELSRLMNGRTIACEPRNHDRYGRTVALCRADGEDLGRAMIRAGLALAFTRYSRDYVDDEAAARSARLGLHSHDCEAPWDWRAKNR